MGITLVDVYLNWLNWSHFLIIMGGLLVIQMDCMIFVWPFLSRTARLRNFLPIKCFPLTYDLSGFMSRINRHALTVGFFETDLLYDFLCFFFLFRTPCLVIAAHPCMEWIPIKKKFARLFYYFNFERNYMWRIILQRISQRVHACYLKKL